MGRRVPKSVLLCVYALVTLAILAAPPIFLAAGMKVLAAESEHSCGGG
jgi:hypothetical protein